MTPEIFSKEFPSDFIWGSATAAYQVEGEPLADGAGPSIWHQFSHLPGTIANDDTADVSAGQYRKMKEDVQLMKWMGLKAYRFSIAWPRIFPAGQGALNEAGLAYYQRLIDELLANGIEPWVTFYHWELPLELEASLGGWRSKETAKLFGDYVSGVTSRISDRVRNYFTVNEIQSFIGIGYGTGKFAPGLTLDKKELAQAYHNACLGHGYAVKAIRANTVQPANIGLAECLENTVPIYELPEHIDAARTAFRYHAANRLVPMLEGSYPDFWLEEMGGDAPDFTDEEMKLISEPVDFLGLNMYAPRYVCADESAKYGFRKLEFPAGYPRMDMHWAQIGPEIAYWIPRFASELWNVGKIYISENGCAAKDSLNRAGEVLDTDRVMYLKNHFLAARRCVEEGYPLNGYFVWSLLDNFEWNSGLEKRFGLVYVNYSSLERTPKLSASYYREVIRANSVL